MTLPGSSSLHQHLGLPFLAALIFYASCSPIATAQSPVAVISINEAALSLPDSPGTISHSTDSNPFAFAASSPSPGAASAAFGHAANPAMASHVDKYIEPGQQAPKLTVGDKILIGLRDAASPLSAAGWVATAGYEQAINGSPNYGSNGRAFAQRLGAAAARDSSEGIFTDSIMASVLREDPRYYKMGSGKNVIKRAAYAATRTIITRTDGGRTTVNLALLSGNLAGSALTQAYYPPVNRGFSQTMQTFGGSIGGSALGFVVSEFIGDALEFVHLKKSE